jgi:type IV fimbrial biogenesis protein FimT
MIAIWNYYVLRGKAMNHRAGGFTLIEVMAALAIVGIAISIAMPSFRSLVVDTRMTATANDMLGAMKLTRSEAVKRNTRVTMCNSSNGTACAATGNWQAGWIVFVDGGTVGSIDTGDEIVHVHGAVADSTIVGGGGVTDFVSYAGNGQTSAAGGGAQVGSISVCATLGGQKRRKIDVTQGSGWVGVRTVAAATTCSDA